MKLLIIGAGGREHAIVRKLVRDRTQSGRSLELYAAPGNPGIEEMATCVAISVEDLQGLLDFAKKTAIDLTVVGPEVPLALGIVDLFEAAGMRIFGPNQAAAQIEASKAYARHEAEQAGVPSPKYRVFHVYDEALSYLRSQAGPWVIKADGLAAGKGVMVTSELREAEDALRQMMADKAFGDAGNQVVIEEFLKGEEISVLAFVDANGFQVFPAIQDHKQVGVGDVGPNTGGMGTFAPVPVATARVMDKVRDEIFGRMVKRFKDTGNSFRGVLFAGLMVDGEQPYLIEFNARFGDPETQVGLELLETDLLAAMEAVVDDRIADCPLEFSKDAAVCVVLAAQGYPGVYAKGDVIRGLDQVQRSYVLQAGTAKDERGQLVTHGGRVLNVVARGDSLTQARTLAYQAVDEIDFVGKVYRTDIGDRFGNLR